MRFSKIYGLYNPDEAKQAEDKVSKVFIELAAKPDSTSMITGLGGDPLIFSLMLPIEHVASSVIPSAATDGKRYIWNIPWILASSYLKIRLTCFHEAFHAQFMHPQRRGKRDWRLWGITVDYIVMGMIFDCLKHHYLREKNPGKTPPDQKAIAKFREGFGNFITIAQLKAKYLDPYKDLPGIETWTPEPFDLEAMKKAFKIEDDLDEDDIKWLETEAEKNRNYKYVFADPDLEDRFKNPYVLYDELHKAIPKCPECGKLGVIVAPSEDKGSGSGSGAGEGDGKGNEPGEGEEGSAGHEGHCGKCHGADEVWGFGGLADEHLDCLEDPTKIAKRLQEAVDMAKRLGAGHLPGGFATDLAELTTPKMRWEDEVRMTMHRIASGNQKNDYTRFRTRPLFAGMFVPKKKGYKCDWAILLDTSGSQDAKAKALALSQAQNLDGRGEGSITYCDAQVYWDDTVKLKSCKPSELAALKPRGGGGTRLAGFFDEYEKRLGKKDFLIVMTDGDLLEDDVAAMKAPSCPVFWLLTSDIEFKQPFGKAFRLKD